MSSLPGKVLGAYWPSWAAPRLSALPSGYNTVWLFAATPVGGTPGSTGAVQWHQSVESAAQFNADLAAFRASARCAILTVGGAGEYIRLDTTVRAQAFVASVKGIYEQLGGFDGIDFDIEGGTVTSAQLIYIATALKSYYGSGFVVTYAPAPWSTADRAVCSAMNTAGVIDLISPQFYDLTGLTDDASKVANLTGSITQSWLPVVAGDASKLGLGYGIADVAAGETMTLPAFEGAWSALLKSYPALRGVFAWNLDGDADQGWAFEAAMAPLVYVPLPSTTYTVKTGDSWQSIASAHNLILTVLMEDNPPIPGQVVKVKILQRQPLS